MDAEVKEALIAHKQAIDTLTAESLALQTLVMNLAAALPSNQRFIIFDHAADELERLSGVFGERAAQLPLSLKVVEQLRERLPK